MASIELSTLILARSLANKTPFIYVRYGDGALECMAGKPGGTCDGELYMPKLAADLKRCWNLLFTRNNVFIGNWETASFDSDSDGNRYRREYSALIDSGTEQGKFLPHFIHFESLLLMRTTPDLVDFYKTARHDGRHKLLMGPEAWRPAAEILQSDFYGLPIRRDLHSIKQDIEAELNKRDFEVLLYGAGMAGNVPVIDFWNEHPEKTFINLGSALDPIYRGRTRKQQVDRETAKSMMERVCA